MNFGDRSIFSYCICKRQLLRCKTDYTRVGEYYVYINKNTHFECRENSEFSVSIIGIAVF